ncbi:hypothetical protein ZYGR_0I05950 [Zygosaccharomyces rouxii]|uniref:Suppressor of mar1-1 protein n=1 Tax=Zygosaccharomyces rouxii TaxID=4956 RepID=A0A1Q2ZY57_ZYGRO|nr:hypothetical protein ZYGR_0I05950 [Zygosaccharomyces rouxii]
MESQRLPISNISSELNMSTSQNDNNNVQDEPIVTGSEDVSIQQLQREVGVVGEKCRKMESLLLSRDSDMTGSLEELFITFRTLSHNQTVLENKLDDALRNQVNTDLMVNSINERLNNLSENMDEVSRFQSTSAQNNSISTEISRPTSSGKRGPGRPRKSASGGLGSRGNELNNGANLTPVKVSLPTGNVQVPKSKRYFNDPAVKPEPAKVKEEQPQSRVRTMEKSVEPTNTPVKRKRGRPPKRRVVETLIVANDKDEQEGLTKKEEEEETAEVTNSKINEDDGGNGDVEGVEEESVDDNIINDQEYRENTPRIISGSNANGPATHGSLPSSTVSSMAPNSGLIPSTVATADSTSLRGNELPQEQQQLIEDADANNGEAQVVVPAPRKRILGANNDQKELVQDEELERQDSNLAADVSTDSAANKLQRELQQRELDKRRDSREKMLVSMKYNDRQKAKSFMESNKKLLQAMREEERRKRMSALIYDSGVSGAQQMLSGTLPSAKLQEHIFKLEEKAPEQSKKMGISTMLNGEDFATSLSSPSSPEGHKRRRSFDYFSDEPHTLHQLRRRKIANYLATPTMGAIDSPSSIGGMTATGDIANDGTNDDDKNVDVDVDDVDYVENTPDSAGNDTNGHVIKGGPPLVVSGGGNANGNSSSNKNSDSQTSLLLTSPIELLCRDGFFFRRNTPENPINVGTYLEFKFKPKEEELINLTMNQKDFADKTKQERINAHFLKPEIQAETEFAFQVLRKITLTEKYVNSLEYFVMEFRWENKLVGLGLKLRESKRTWQRRKALFSLFEFWRDQSREKRGFPDYTMMHAVKEMENYRIFINRSVSWFYNHITLLKMILYDLCDNVDSQWREWMFTKDSTLPTLGQDGVTEENINEALDNVLTLDFLDDGTENSEIKSHSAMPMSEKTTDDEVDVDELDDDDQEQEQEQEQKQDHEANIDEAERRL